jgi:hypothetical protein
MNAKEKTLETKEKNLNNREQELNILENKINENKKKVDLEQKRPVEVKRTKKYIYIVLSWESPNYSNEEFTNYRARKPWISTIIEVLDYSEDKKYMEIDKYAVELKQFLFKQNAIRDIAFNDENKSGLKVERHYARITKKEAFVFNTYKEASLNKDDKEASLNKGD